MKNLDNPKVWQNIELETAKFTFEASQKLLLETIDTAKILTDRAVNILQFTIPLSLAIITLVFKKDIHPLFLHISILTLVTCAIMSWKCLEVYRLYEIMPAGNSAEKMLNLKKLDRKGDEQVVQFYIGAIISTENSIQFNLHENRKRSAHIFAVIRTMQFGILAVTCYAILWFPVFRCVFE